MVHSESLKELSDTPDHPLSAHPFSSPASMTTSAPLFSAVALRSAGIRLGEREFVFLQLLDMSILRNMARRNTQSLTCCCSPGSLWVQAEGIKKVLNSNRGNETTFVQLNPISFPGIKTPKGMILSPYGPENVARQLSAIHCIPKDIS